MKSLMRLYRFLNPYRVQAGIALILLVGMVAADLVIPHLTRRIIDQGIIPKDIHVVIQTALYMVGPPSFLSFLPCLTTICPWVPPWDSAPSFAAP